MRQFGAYTLDALMAMPFPAFAELLELATRAQADFTLETIVAGLAATRREPAEELRRRRDNIPPPSAVPRRRLSAEELSRAGKLARIYMKKRSQPEAVSPIAVDELHGSLP
ncbi:MAG: hypothetical protein PHQ27_10245 [Victivallales bacterium]|nr:hypothetical protein [Victivallales bacterium]